jgi:hypothetical protein
MKKLGFLPKKVIWFNPKNGQQKNMETKGNNTSKNFDPPGENENGNDWVLILEK